MPPFFMRADIESAPTNRKNTLPKGRVFHFVFLYYSRKESSCPAFYTAKKNPAPYGAGT